MGSRSASATYNPSDTGQLSHSLKRGPFVCKTEGGNAGHPETVRRLNRVDVACAWHLVSLRYAAVTPLCVTSTLTEEEVSAPGRAAGRTWQYPHLTRNRKDFAKTESDDAPEFFP